MKFWDASALVPLLITQPSSDQMERIADEDPSITTWWATSLEFQSAVARLEREGVRRAAVGEALVNLRALEESWTEIAPSSFVRSVAGRLLRTHQLRTGDALLLAAAIAAADGNPRSLPFVTLDERLALAASKEGFPIIGTA